MATSSGTQKVSEDTIEQFVAVTGADRSVAVSLLEACAGNLDLAVGMHMDSGQAGPSSSGNDDTPVVTGVEEGVRAPIPQKTEVLVEEDASKLAYRMRRPRRYARSVFDGFRDFQAESHQLDESVKGKRLSKKRNLEDLFRPPVDMTYKGTFQGARDFGSGQNRWLLVNVQNVQEFPCQLLNRDVWSNQEARALIKDNFVFWQVYNDSEEGKRFIQFYKLNQWPYVAVIDPFTGESQIVWNKISDGAVFCELAKDFLTMCPVPDSSQLTAPAKRQKRDPSIVDATEQEQLEAAIQASLVETEKKASSPQYVCSSDSEADVIGDSDDDDNDVETFSDSDDVVVSSPPPQASAASTNGNLRGSKEPLSSCVSNASSSSSHPPSKNSPKNKPCTTATHRTSPSSKHKKLLSSTQTSASSSSSSSSHPSSLSSRVLPPAPSSNSSSSSSRQNLHRLTSTLNNTEIRITHDDVNDGVEDNTESDDGEDPRVSSIWGASGPSTSSSLLSNQQQRHHGLGPAPPEDSENNSLLDLLGTREAEVSTPQMYTQDEEDDDDNDNDDNSKGKGESGDENTKDSVRDSEVSGADSQPQDGDWKRYWGSSDDPLSKIVLRFPDNKREQVQLPCSSQLKALSEYCMSKGYPSKEFELVTNFPRRKLSQMDSSTTLKEAGLHPQDTVFVQDV